MIRNSKTLSFNKTLQKVSQIRIKIRVKKKNQYHINNHQKLSIMNQEMMINYIIKNFNKVPALSFNHMSIYKNRQASKIIKILILFKLTIRNLFFKAPKINILPMRTIIVAN